ncbi:MAG: tRNA pseudouridine(38-40) synthase TruA [Rikenellaceae bacterium]|nr:tRNA pseudouridine(38-40) synthase TruA [Rikenellaceae bacterium]
MRYFIEMSYKGTDYHGWQVQVNAVSVQGVLEEALSKLLRSEVEVTGAGRTDTGVHASYFVAHFDTAAAVYGDEDGRAGFVYHLNALLPRDIAVRSVTLVDGEAHARFDARLREYRYFLLPYKDAFRSDTAWYYRGPLDTDAMNAAAGLLPEYEDFTTFCKLHSGNKTNICRVSFARWERQQDGGLVFTIRADRFLRNMVRSLTGTLTDVGKGKMSVEGFRDALAAKDLSRAGNTAPAAGLFLSDIRYPDEIFTRQY